MKIGFSLSNNQGIEDVQLVLGLASKAEDLGFDSVWAAEHVFNVSYVHDRIGNRPYYEPLSILSYAAATTKRIALGTSVLVLPYHNPMRLAKTAATIDVISGGRLILGVGVGVIEQELEAMGSSLKDRGAYTDECIAIMKELWTQDDPAYQGKFHSFSGMTFSPRPVQQPHIPLVIGGTSRAAIRRAGQVGQRLASHGVGAGQIAPREWTTWLNKPLRRGETRRRCPFRSAPRLAKAGQEAAMPWDPMQMRFYGGPRNTKDWGYTAW